jgi:hemerythrin-like metal-binding protein
MVFFEWDNKLCTNIPIIDEQHKKLISFVNELHEAMRNKKGKEVVGKILNELKEYTIYHFGTEEKAFDKYNYPKKAEHKKYHADLIRQVKELQDNYEKGKIAISIDVFNFLTNWVKNHIMKEDMEYVPLLKDKTIEQ